MEDSLAVTEKARGDVAKRNLCIGYADFDTSATNHV